MITLRPGNLVNYLCFFESPKLVMFVKTEEIKSLTKLIKTPIFEEPYNIVFEHFFLGDGIVFSLTSNKKNILEDDFYSHCFEFLEKENTNDHQA